MTAQLDLLSDLPYDGVAPRAAALSLLAQILARKKMLDAALESDAAYAELSLRDRALARMIVSTVLRRKGQMDDLIARAVQKESPRPNGLRWILYIGLAQILFMDIPDHAAVDTSVRLAAQNGMEGQKGFVNAILRRMAGEGRGWMESQDSAALNFPGWLYAQLVADYGVVRARDIGQACLAEAPLDLTVKDKESRAEWAKKLGASMLQTGTLRVTGGGAVPALEGFDEGAWWVQDASSALPVAMMGDLNGKSVLDLCAAPGGKTMQLAAAGAHVTALDRSAARISQLSDNLKRTRFEKNVRTVIEDGSVWSSKELFDIVLLDAPCTATGTIRRHPDLLHLKEEKDQAGLISIQERLFLNAARLVKPGGYLFYCTCSLQKDEGERQVKKFLLSHQNFRRIPGRREEFASQDGFVNGDGDVRILPTLLREAGGMDGFFISRLQKIAGV
jgi:16S rRNA (cytosine967-C5)-methyltransferase